MMHLNQSQEQQQQLEMMQQNHQYPPPYAVNLTALSGQKETATGATASTTPIGNVDANTIHNTIQ